MCCGSPRGGRVGVDFETFDFEMNIDVTFNRVALRRQLFEEIWDEENWEVGKCRPSVVKSLVVKRGANGFGYKGNKVRVSPLVF